MATAISKTRPATKWKSIAWILALTAGIIFADEAQRKIFTARAGAEFQRAQAWFQTDATNPTNAWQFARAAFDFAEFAATDAERAALANQGIAACRQGIVRVPKSAAAQPNWTGEKGGPSWGAWPARRNAARQEINQTTAPVKSPRGNP